MKHERLQQGYGASVATVILLTALVLLTMTVRGGPPRRGQSGPESSDQTSTASSASESSSPGTNPVNTVPEDGMRAMWVPYMSLAVNTGADQSQAVLQKKFNAIVANAKSKGMNTLIVHMRPFSDALYQSDYFPRSHILTGIQGINPGYDLFAYMIQVTHKAGLKIHAWVNPPRIRTSNTPATLAQNSPYSRRQLRRSSGRAVALDNDVYYSPAYPEILKLITDGITEVVRKHDVDDVQFDDYFYPTEGSTFDTGSCGAYLAEAKESGNAMDLFGWRHASISKMMPVVCRKIESVKPGMMFGISPQGNVQNDLHMGTDMISWASTAGYVGCTYLQLYVDFESPILPFDDGAKQWRQMVAAKGVQLYFGPTVYKAGSGADKDT